MIHPRFPIYIPSKSRWASRLTMQVLDRMQVRYRVIVEAQQYEQYAAVLPADRLLVLDPKLQETYDPCDGLGQAKPLGSGPARNMAWEHSTMEGAQYHWVIDDNIAGFYWLNRNRRVLAGDAAPLVAMEDFVTQYSNVAMAGPDYDMFAPSRLRYPPFRTGTRIFSCILIRNDVPFRWRCRYSEDLDLSLRLLKAGWNTVQFEAFLQKKLWTQTMRGGNTEAFYAVEGTWAKTQLMVALHPDCVRATWQFGRHHHHVDYSRWRGRPLIPNPQAPPVHQFHTSEKAR